MRFLLPYDGSAVARAALCHFTDTAHRRWSMGSLTLVLAAGQRCAIHRQLTEARRLVGDDVVLSFRLLGGDDLHRGLERLAGTVPRPMFVAPLNLRGTTPWYQAIAGSLLTGKYGICVAIDRLPAVSATPLRGRARASSSSAHPRRNRYVCRGVRGELYRRHIPRRLEGSP